MKLQIKGRNSEFLVINDLDIINKKIQILKEALDKNPTKNPMDKFLSLFSSEIFNNMMIEGEISSRKQIRDDFSRENKNFNSKSYYDFKMAFNFILQKKEFLISNLFTLYSIISNGRIMDKNKIKDGQMFRNEGVEITSNHKMGKKYEGFKPKDIKDALHIFFKFIQNSNYDIYLRAIVGHIYFEMIHPFYDFNGRVGRFIPLWIFSNENRTSEMMYFATAMGHFRMQYLLIFKNINVDTYEVNLDKMVIKVLDLLIMNQKQYTWLKRLENKFLDKIKKNFSAIQKNLIWKLMIKSEISNYEGSWFKMHDDDKEFIELKMTPQSFSNAIRLLRENKIIDVSHTTPKKYKLNNYKLFGLKNN